jgi:hypothetical protein
LRKRCLALLGVWIGWWVFLRLCLPLSLGGLKLAGGSDGGREGLWGFRGGKELGSGEQSRFEGYVGSAKAGQPVQ